MIYQELVTTVKRLPLQQRLRLMEELAYSVRAELPVEGKRPSSLARVRGMLKVEGEPPTDQELIDDRIDHLIKR